MIQELKVTSMTKIDFETFLFILCRHPSADEQADIAVKFREAALAGNM